MSKKVSMEPLMARIAAAVACYASGGIPAGSLAPQTERDCRYAPSFTVSGLSDWGLPTKRYNASTLAKHLGVTCDQTFKAALGILAAHEAGTISQEVFEGIVSGETAMTVVALRELCKGGL